MVSDPIADFLTRIRNACMLRKQCVQTPLSKASRRLAQIFKERGFVKGYELDTSGRYAQLVVQLKYDDKNCSVIEGLRRVSRPGHRVYCDAQNLPKVQGGMGIAVISSSRSLADGKGGMITDTQARKLGVGGEVICKVW
ncbi:MAG: 30S ribosomal protein S8 [Myxococcota bacterium]